MTTVAPGCSALNARSWSAVIMSAMGQPALGCGRSTCLSGERIEALSAMKCTPQKTMMSASVWEALIESSSESPVMSATSCTGPIW